MLFDWQARIRIKATPRDRLSYTQIQAFAKRRAEAVAFARAFLRQAQQKYEKQANRLRRPIDWQTGNKIYVRKSN
jgi:alpha-D-ribose 1-methylphosphonate 5-triphosphate synthase subunit PhnG